MRDRLERMNAVQLRRFKEQHPAAIDLAELPPLDAVFARSIPAGEQGRVPVQRPDPSISVLTSQLAAHSVSVQDLEAAIRDGLHVTVAGKNWRATGVREDDGGWTHILVRAA